MSKKHKKILSASAIKFIEDNEFIQEYLKGNKTIEELSERGIKLATPISSKIEKK